MYWNVVKNVNKKFYWLLLLVVKQKVHEYVIIFSSMSNELLTSLEEMELKRTTKRATQTKREIWNKNSKKKLTYTSEGKNVGFGS